MLLKDFLGEVKFEKVRRQQKYEKLPSMQRIKKSYFIDYFLI